MNFLCQCDFCHSLLHRFLMFVLLLFCTCVKADPLPYELDCKVQICTIPSLLIGDKYIDVLMVIDLNRWKCLVYMVRLTGCFENRLSDRVDRWPENKWSSLL